MSADPYAIPTLIYDIIQEARAREPDRPALIGVGGAQGSGKSYWCTLLEASNRPRFAHFSLDDVYLTKATRQLMARTVHPLCITRGPPGSHDLLLLEDMLMALDDGGENRLPRFDKRTDDRAPKEEWPVFNGRPEAILIDGWCVGAKPVDGDNVNNEPPLNALEASDDADGQFRWLANQSLKEEYQEVFARFDAIVYLRAPSWEIVRRWRGEQEEKLLGRPLTAEENAALDRFVMYFERVTRSMLEGHHSAKWIVHLDEARNVTRIEQR